MVFFLMEWVFWVALSGLTRMMMVLSLLTAVFAWEYLEYSAARAGAPMPSSRMHTRTSAVIRKPFFIKPEIPGGRQNL